MWEVNGGVFVNEPNVGLIAEAMRRIYNEGIAKECYATLPSVTVVCRSTGETVSRQPRSSA